MSARERAEQWILSKCGDETSEPIDVPFSTADLPTGVSIALLKRVFMRMRSAGQIGGNIFAVSDNTDHSFLDLKRL